MRLTIRGSGTVVTMQAVGLFTLRVIPDDQLEYAGNLDFHLDAPGVEGYIMGRSDSGSSYTPDIDLAPFNAQRRGISRRHAVLLRYQGSIHILDLGSMNGTFINDKQLHPQVIFPLTPGDQLRLANLSLIISPSS